MPAERFAQEISQLAVLGLSRYYEIVSDLLADGNSMSDLNMRLMSSGASRELAEYIASAVVATATLADVHSQTKWLLNYLSTRAYVFRYFYPSEDPKLLLLGYLRHTGGMILTEQNHQQGRGYWDMFPTDYRADEIAKILGWVKRGESGVVVGGSGSGKSNIAGYIAFRPEIVRRYLSQPLANYLFCLFDVNSLPTINTAYFYRAMLLNLKLTIELEAPQLGQEADMMVRHLRDPSDTFELFFALLHLHALVVHRLGRHVVWLIDRFDDAWSELDVTSLNSLRRLRDDHRFRGRLSIIVFSRHKLQRIRTASATSEFVEIMESNTCWVGPMKEADALWNVSQIAQRYDATITPDVALDLIAVSGGWPSLTKATVTAFIRDGVPKGVRDPSSTTRWAEIIAATQAGQRTCHELFEDLTQDERDILFGLGVDGQRPADVRSAAFSHLLDIGLVTYEAKDGMPSFSIFSPVLTQFLRQSSARRGILTSDGLGPIRIDGRPLALPNMPSKLLAYFIRNEGEICAINELMDCLWPGDDDARGSVEALQRYVADIRKKLKSEAAPMHEYVENRRGVGYIFSNPALES